MSILVKKDNQWLSVKNIYCCQNNRWNAIKECYVRQSGIWRSIWKNAIIFINGSPQTSINIFELMGRPAKVGNYVLINNSEITARNGEPALKTGVFPQASTLSIINNSYITGYGGNGGSCNSKGQDGGTAINVEMPCHIDNTNGYIYGGGGGGGGMTVNTNTLNYYRNYFMGGAGGAPNGEITENFSRTSTGYYDVYEFLEPIGQDGGRVKAKLYAASLNLLLRDIEFITGNGGEFGEKGKPSEIIKNTPLGMIGSYNTADILTFEGGAAGLSINKNNFEVTIINSDPEKIKGEVR